MEILTFLESASRGESYVPDSIRGSRRPQQWAATTSCHSGDFIERRRQLAEV
jgi:hypothetical protein